jgi:hypothetical protein
MNFAADFLGNVGLTARTLLPLIDPVGTAVLLFGIGAQFVINGVRERLLA